MTSSSSTVLYLYPSTYTTDPFEPADVNESIQGALVELRFKFRHHYPEESTG
jgi:hypothetical protein